MPVISKNFTTEYNQGFGPKASFQFWLASRVTIHHLQHISIRILLYMKFFCKEKFIKFSEKHFKAQKKFFCKRCVIKYLALRLRDVQSIARYSVKTKFLVTMATRALTFNKRCPPYSHQITLFQLVSDR